MYVGRCDNKGDKVMLDLHFDRVTGRRIDLDTVIQELSSHGVYADFDTDGTVYDVATGSTIARPGYGTLYDVNDVLQWLGY
jgi:hypothetical protein